MNKTKKITEEMIMKYNKGLIIWACLLGLLIITPDFLAQGIKKEMNVGYVRWVVVDQADEGEGSWGWSSNSTFWNGYYGESTYSSKAVMMGSKNWKDESGNNPVAGGIKISGHGQWEIDDQHIMMPVPDGVGNTINRYYRYNVPSLTVNGLPISEFFPQNSADKVAPENIPGNADGLITSYVNTDMGVSFSQRAIAFSQQNHNKYIIKEYVFKNTGNTDLDDEIELNQTIEGFYFLKQLRTKEDPQRPWVSAVGQYPGDEIRMVYGYPTREPETEFDNLGDPSVEGADGFLNNPYFMGEALLFASKSPSEFDVNDDNQPHMTGYTDVDFPSFTFHSWNMTSDQKTTLYEVMENGLSNVEGINWPELAGTKTGTHHGVPLDEFGIPYITEMPGFGYSASVCYSVGPYNLAPGDSIKIVIADCQGAISPEVANEVGEKWFNNIDPGTPEGWANASKLPQQYIDFPELYAEDEKSEIVNLNKDKWILSGRDSLFAAARAAKFAFDNNYTVPAPPPPLSVSVSGFADGIKVEWGDEADSHPGLSGFNVYRSEGSYYPGVPYGESEFIGSWEKVSTKGVGEHEFIDTSPSRAVAYFYAVTAFDNGGAGNDFDGSAHVLESNPYSSLTTVAGFLTRPGGNLESVVVVPNPYNVAANALLYPGENNKIAFLDVPVECTIRIFSESGDLIKTIEHSGSGDAYWGDIPNDHQTTETGQLVVSGVYIAHFEIPDGNSTIKKFIIVR